LRHQVDDKVLELECGLAVKRSLGNDAHLHTNFITQKNDGNVGMEIDGLVVHSGGEKVPNSQVYFIECGYNPNLSKVKKTLDRMENFKDLAKNYIHFKPATKFFPVFGAKLFSSEVNNFCKTNKIWQVIPSGGGYQIIRNFSIFTKKLK
jgi:hypothetical protein